MLAVLAVVMPMGVAVAIETDLGTPVSDPILTFSGGISHANDGDQAQFDRAMIDQLPQHAVRTSSPWYDGPRTFEGPLLRDVLAAVGAEGSQLRVVALNDYAAEIPFEDAMTYDLVLATSVDGEPLSIRERGPLWIMYPYDDHAELQAEVYYGRAVWQVRSIEVLP
jgi:hypothetical protein